LADLRWRVAAAEAEQHFGAFEAMEHGCLRAFHLLAVSPEPFSEMNVSSRREICVSV
jgi:hypothetical protein